MIDPLRHDSLFRRGRATSGLLLVLSFLLPAAPLAAQRPGQVVLRGNVVDTESSTPVFGAYIAHVGSTQGTLTDSVGRFALAMNRAASYSFRIVQLGYHTLEATMPAEAEGRAFTVGLKPGPIALEGLTVLTDQLADRRRGRFGIATILDQGELLNSSFGTAYELTRQVMPFADLCSPQADSLCVSSQGRRTPVSICMDGRAISSASPELEVLDPRGLYLVEAYFRVGRVAMYSRGYVARLIETGQQLPPFSFGCGGMER